MILIEDSRQKKDKHALKNEFWASEGDTVIRCKLPFGDYALIPSVSVDTKADVVEIAQNMCGNSAERRRFAEEVKGARDAGCKLVFLIEDKRYRTVADLYGQKIWTHTGVTIKGDQLALAMETMSARYGCEFRFCSPEDAGRVVKEILNGEESEKELD